MINPHVRRAVRLLVALSAAASLATTAIAQEPEDVVDSGDDLEEVTVTARQKSAATDVLQERIEQSVVVDLVGAEQISRVGDSTVSLALRRLPGVTLVGDQFIYIRGLGERYSSTTLNGAYVPSPDLTRNVIPLDIFPAEIIDSISIQKGYSVDRPAAFGGGNIDIRTRGVPEGLVAEFKVGSGWNSDNSDDVLKAPGGGDDKWGTDDGTRALPGEISAGIADYQGSFSSANILQALRRDGQFHTIGEAEAINRQLATSLNRDIDIQSESANPDVSLEAVLGDSWILDEAGYWKFGLLGIADYGNNWRNRDRINRSVLDPEQTVARTQRSVNQVSLTGSINAGLEFTEDHKVNVMGLYLRNTDDEASVTQRTNFNFRREGGQQLRDYRTRFEERDLQLVQVLGNHTLGADTQELLSRWFETPALLADLNLSWYTSTATATTDIPNEVTVSGVDQIDPATGAVLQSSIRLTSSAADFRFTDLDDEVNSFGWKLEQPFTFGEQWRGSISGGYDYYEKGRGYVQTQIGLGTTNSAASGVLVGTPSQVFTDAVITNPSNGFLLNIGGIGTESYLAGETIVAGFGAFDVTWNEAWRVSGGVRWEDFEQVSVPVDPLQFDATIGKIPLPADQLDSIATTVDDFYPALALTHIREDFWSEDFQLRFGWSQTTARPDLREVSGATFIDPFTEFRVTGNPGLVPSDLVNYDVRAEWFFANRDNLTLSLFYKDIENPIETVQAAGTDDNEAYTFINAATAEVYGVELEWFKDLGFLGDRIGNWASGFFFAGNLTWADSELTVGANATGLTNNKRPLTLQSDYVVNIQLGYDSPGGAHSSTLVYNTAGERLFFAGRDGAPDAYEQPFESLDLIYTWYPSDFWNLKLRLQNLLDDNIEIDRGGVTTFEQEIGMTLKLDVTFKF